MKTPARRWLYWIAIFTVIGYIGARQFNAEDYPDDWPSPSVLPGWRGGCPNIAGEYDGVDQSIPRMLAGKEVWESGVRAWFEHKAAIVQAKDGSSLSITFALNERGLTRHREHVLKHGQAWPNGHFAPLELNSRNHYDCSMRWLTLDSRAGYRHGEAGPGRVRLSVDRKGNLIVGYTKQERKGFGDLFGQSIGPNWTSDTTRWVRWTRRDPAADVALKAAQSFSITRMKHYAAAHGSRQLITLGNFTGEDVCARLWDQAGRDPDDPKSGIRNAGGVIGEQKRAKDGSLYVDLPCPDGWEWLRATEFRNYFVEIDEGVVRDYRVAHRPLAKPDAPPTVREVGEIAALPAPWEK
jgi:hypothetical protein